MSSLSSVDRVSFVHPDEWNSSTDRADGAQCGRGVPITDNLFSGLLKRGRWLSLEGNSQPCGSELSGVPARSIVMATRVH